jgi:hypothetical protein
VNAREYRRAQDQALKALLQQIRRLFLVYGVPITGEQQDEMAALLLRSMRGARERTYQVATTYIESQLVLADVPDLPDYQPQALAKLLDAALTDFQVHGDPITDRNRKDAVVAVQGGKRAQRAAARHAQQPAREAVKRTADNIDGIGWARMLTGPTSCPFCAMLASRGPVYTSEKAALKRGGAGVDTYHDGCDCVAVLVTNPTTWEGRDAAEKLDDLWISASRKRGSTLKIFRREWNQKVRSGESGDFVADTMK